MWFSKFVSEVVFKIYVWGFINQLRLLQYDHVCWVPSRPGVQNDHVSGCICIAWVFFLVGRREIGV